MSRNQFPIACRTTSRTREPVTGDRRRLVTGGQVPGMANRVDADRHECAERRSAHADSTKRQRPRPANTTSATASSGPSRRLPVYEYVTSPMSSPAGDALQDAVGAQSCDPLEPEEEKHDEERLRRGLDRHPPQLEEPRASARRGRPPRWRRGNSGSAGTPAAREAGSPPARAPPKARARRSGSAR